jgi:hypothetical protein
MNRATANPQRDHACIEEYLKMVEEHLKMVEEYLKMKKETNDITGGEQHGGKHYKDMGIQPIEYAEANRKVLGPAAYSVVKYVTRHEVTEKAEPGKGWKDIKKVFQMTTPATVSRSRLSRRSRRKSTRRRSANT